MLSRHMRWLPIRRGASLVVALLIAGPFAGVAPRESRVSLRPVFSLNDNDVSKLHPRGAWLDGFDISPDGKTFVAEFEALQAGQEAAIWVGEWNIVTRKLIVQEPVWGPAPLKQLISGQYRFDLRFTPDGKKLIALTGPEVRVLGADTLRVLFSVSAGKILPVPTAGLAIRQFLVSGDGKLLAVVSSPTQYPWETVECRLFNLETGEKLGAWDQPISDAAGFSLSPNGNELLESFESLRPFSQIALLDARSGKMLRTLHSGFTSLGSGLGMEGETAKFLDNDHIVVVSPTPSGPPHVSLKIVNIHTGEVIQEFNHEKHDYDAWYFIARQSGVIAAMIFSWKWGIRWNLDDPFRRPQDRLVLFHVGDAEPFCVRHNVPLFQGGGPSAVLSLRGLLRISSGGNIVALGVGKDIKVYRVFGGISRK